MGYWNLRECVEDLERHGRLIRLAEEVDARLEAAEIHRRVYASGGPAVLYENVRGCRFPMVSNLFGSLEQARFLFRDTIEDIQALIQYKIDPARLLKQWWKLPWAAWTASRMLPTTAWFPAVTAHETRVDQLPSQVSSPDDGGPFITLPQVYTEHVDKPGVMHSNLGMYRVQYGGNSYEPNRQIGLHYQIHRGIGVHHAAALQAGQPLRVHIFVGGTPAMMVAAVMPLPEGLSELTFAGALAGHRIPLTYPDPTGLPIYSEADFCITGTIDPERMLPEGPFGDHLGYYSLTHDYPVLNVEKVYHREGAIWPFTVVGRPPQEDTTFGDLIHELTGPVIPTVVHGVRAVNAVDAAGVHPLLLAIGSERYQPYNRRERPLELLTQANAILGQGQLSLAKYLCIVAEQDAPDLDIHNIPAFLAHLLARIDWRRDVHFQTETTIDTLDYSGSDVNIGSKVVWAAVGEPIRELPREMPAGLTLPEPLRDPRVCLPGVVAVSGPPCEVAGMEGDGLLGRVLREVPLDHPLNAFPLVVLVDDSRFTAESLNNFLWVVFTRSNPASDIDGVAAFTHQKHWGCRGSLWIDARLKPRHAPPVEPDPETVKKVDALAARGGPLAKWL